MKDRVPETQIWKCDPLVVANEGGDIVFAGRSVIEFTPDDLAENTGTAFAPDLMLDDKAFRIVVDAVGPRAPSPSPGFYFALRDGRTLWGHDDAGNTFTWFVNADAERALREYDAGLKPGVVLPDDIEPAT